MLDGGTPRKAKHQAEAIHVLTDRPIAAMQCVVDHRPILDHGTLILFYFINVIYVAPMG
jgi:hypothetical protein